MTVDGPQFLEDGLTVMGVTSQNNRADALLQVSFAHSAAAGCHAGGNALNAGVGGQFDGDDIPAHFGTALTLFVKQAAAALDPPCLELGNDHKNAPLVDRVKGIGCLITGILLCGKESLTETRQ